MTVGSAFTVGVADERHTTLTRVMAAALELDREFRTQQCPVMSQLSILSQAKIQLIFKSQVTVDFNESSQVTLIIQTTNYTQMSFICHIHNYTEYNEE